MCHFIGASSGIGAEAAIQFTRNGASLVITGRNEQGLDKVIESCDISHGNRVN